MPKKQRKASGQTSLRVGDISGVHGSVNIAGGDIATQHNTTTWSGEELQRLFDQIYNAVESRPNTPLANKEDLKTEVQAIQATVSEAAKNNQKPDEGFLAYRFRNIARMAPDILDVVVATLANPLMGLGVAAAKIREKAKEETKGD